MEGGREPWSGGLWGYKDRTNREPYDKLFMDNGHGAMVPAHVDLGSARPMRWHNLVEPGLPSDRDDPAFAIHPGGSICQSLQ